MNKNGIRVIFQGQEMAYRTAMDKIEEMGLCTLCVRDMHPHDTTPECKKTHLRVVFGEVIDIREA